MRHEHPSHRVRKPSIQRQKPAQSWRPVHAQKLPASNTLLRQLSPSPFRSGSGKPAGLVESRQQQATILQLQQEFGNAHVVQMLTQLNGAGGNGTVQRALSKEEKAKNLTHPRFAGDPDLEKAFDNAPPLRRGRRCEGVKKIQQALIDNGYLMPESTKKSGEMDGIFGKETHQAVRRFQKEHHLGIDGSVGRETLARLEELLGGPKAPEIKPDENPEIAVTEEELGKHIVEKMNEANVNSPESGIWYSHVRRAWNKKNPAKYTWNEDWRSGYADPAYWVRIDWMKWILKPGVSASAGLKAWLKGLTIAECASTMVAIEIDTIRAAIGDKKFDDNYGSQDKIVPPDKRLRISQSMWNTPFGAYIVGTESPDKDNVGSKDNRPAKVGEWYYFFNHPKYLLKHPDGAWQGENAIYAGRNDKGQQLWSGLGASNRTEDALLLDMQQAYNNPRTEQDYEKIVTYYTIRPIPKPGPEHPTHQDLYFTYLNRVDPKYRHDKGEFKDKITDTQEILDHPPYTIDGEERKGGFQAGGLKLDVEKIKKLKEG